ncbi:hypothetical protein LCL97_11985 [Seohaeicola saemankumensis]|nr:SO2930 family diheme c-type cytochrome [Seohaeicola saemankumensis]MCA0871549.1 hypothetical protein [Seohaeicola saemankumensis]
MSRFKAAVVALFCLACPAAAEVNDAAIAAKRPPKLLSAFGFFTDLATQQADPALAGYELSSPLFTDYADKSRWIYSPTPAPSQTDGVLQFPVGSALIKTFHYGGQKVETRLLLHRADGWAAYPYVWNDDGTEAELKIAGKTIPMDTPHGPVTYRVPNMNQCKACHVDAAKSFQPIGPKLRNLNLGDQLARLAAHGVIEPAPADTPAVPDYRDTGLPLEIRARAYLDANCAHCHAPGLPADTSGLYLNWEETRPVHLGINKKPVAAGRGSGGLLVDIAPGQPDQSILMYRILSTDPGEMMPEIGRSVVDEEGAQLLRDWIASLD